MIENRIKDYRSDRGMTQTELAKLVGVRRETIYNLENGKYNPSLSLAWKIAEVFEASIEDVFTVQLDPTFMRKLAQMGGSPVGN
ncbi:MAG: helix-turn-helix transcriptional regulator [Oscillospiraceae bacterium]|nr:helix-turn-helix transcriptional regulator [Oscillospiraceae bacterium]